MSDSLVFTIIGADRPGVVEQISRVVNAHEANWLGSRMGQLGGKFAGMIQVQGERAQLDSLKLALEALEGLTVVVEVVDETTTSQDEVAEASRTAVTMLGLDRPGIVKEVSSALASEGINVLALETAVSAAAMTGRLMFSGRALIALPPGYDIGVLAERLAAISADLGVDIELSDEDV